MQGIIRLTYCTILYLYYLHIVRISSVLFGQAESWLGARPWDLQKNRTSWSGTLRSSRGVRQPAVANCGKKVSGEREGERGRKEREVLIHNHFVLRAYTRLFSSAPRGPHRAALLLQQCARYILSTKLHNRLAKKIEFVVAVSLLTNARVVHVERRPVMSDVFSNKVPFFYHPIMEMQLTCISQSLPAKWHRKLVH